MQFLRISENQSQVGRSCWHLQPKRIDYQCFSVLGLHCGFCENETNLKIIQEIMGHADIATTMNVYNEATKEKKKESFSNLEGKIKIS